MDEKPTSGAEDFRELSEDELEALAYSGELGRYFTIVETTGRVELPLWSELTATREPEQHSIPARLAETPLAESTKLHVKISQATVTGIARAVAEKRAEQWVKENAGVFESWNDYVEKNGLPLAKYRNF
ncbi:MAG: type II toxin-antitoxin system CcdA family antitoxin [Proteobacteria bacterium]|nr:type II toxin-antitoxin system CcdA family antitoxin [Pseudomonadota bacterium]